MLSKILQIFDLAGVSKDEMLHMAGGRRAFFGKAKELTLKAAIVAIPAALLVLPKTVYARTATVTDVLNFALTLEYLEDEFYKAALAVSGTTLIPSADRTIFLQISKHETAHVNFLKGALGASAIAKPSFDFTAGGTYSNVFSNYQTFLTLSQAFEDTGVRAYKGQAGNLISDNDTLTAALQIHSVEARHASEVRRLRGQVTSQAIKGWVSNETNYGAPAASYTGESNTTHAGANIAAIASLEAISSANLTEAFDEPLTQAAVEAIVAPFIVTS